MDVSLYHPSAILSMCSASWQIVTAVTFFSHCNTSGKINWDHSSNGSFQVRKTSHYLRVLLIWLEGPLKINDIVVPFSSSDFVVSGFGTFVERRLFYGSWKFDSIVVQNLFKPAIFLNSYRSYFFFSCSICHSQLYSRSIALQTDQTVKRFSLRFLHQTPYRFLSSVTGDSLDSFFSQVSSSRECCTFRLKGDNLSSTVVTVLKIFFVRFFCFRIRIIGARYKRLTVFPRIYYLDFLMPKQLSKGFNHRLLTISGCRLDIGLQKQSHLIDCRSVFSK